MARRALELEGLDNSALDRRRPVEHTVKSEAVPLVVVMDISPFSTITNVVLVERDSVVSWTQPLPHEIGLDVGTEEDLGRSVEFSRNQDLRHTWNCNNFRLSHVRLLFLERFHQYVQLLAARPRLRRVVQIVLPKTAGNWRATRSLREGVRLRGD